MTQSPAFYFDLLCELCGDGSEPYDVERASELAAAFWDAAQEQRQTTPAIYIAPRGIPDDAPDPDHALLDRAYKRVLEVQRMAKEGAV